jgi:hypothetical protein
MSDDLKAANEWLQVRDAAMLAAAPDWWRNRVLAVRNCKTDSERRALQSTSFEPVEHRSARLFAESRRTTPYDALRAKRAWQEKVVAEFEAEHPKTTPSVVRRRNELLNTILS